MVERRLNELEDEMDEEADEGGDMEAELDDPGDVVVKHNGEVDRLLAKPDDAASSFE